MVTDIEINLIEGLKEQSPKAQQMMVERYGRHVFNQVVRLLPSVEDAEEVYQDVFLKVFLNILKSATIIQYTIKGRFMSR